MTEECAWPVFDKQQLLLPILPEQAELSYLLIVYSTCEQCIWNCEGKTLPGHVWQSEVEKRFAQRYTVTDIIIKICTKEKTEQSRK